MLQTGYIAFSIIGESIAFICVELGNTGKPMPEWIYIFTSVLCTLFGISDENFDQDEHHHKHHHKHQTEDDVENENSKENEQEEEKEGHKPTKRDPKNWLLLGVAASRFTLIAYVLLIVVTPLITFVAVVDPFFE